MTPLVGAACLVLAVFVLLVLTQPVVRRLALRNSVRRPREALLVMLGCMLGTALVVGNGAVGDSFTTSISDDALARLGPLDAVVSFDNPDNWAAGTRRLADAPAAAVRASTAAATLEVPMTAGNSAAPRGRMFELDHARAVLLGTEAETGLTGRGPRAGHAWASPSLAEALDLRPGATVTVHAGTPVTFIVDRITPDNGLTEFTEAAADPKGNLLVPPGSIRSLTDNNPATAVPRLLALVAGPRPSGAAADALASSAPPQALRSQLSSRVAGLGANVALIKSERLADAKAFGASARFFLITIGTFGMAAGILLLINVFLMLAEERLAELGTMRAVGLSRRPFVAAFSAEGCIYSLFGAILGGFVGLGLGGIMVSFAARSLKADGAVEAGIDLQFSANAKTFASGVAAGFLVAVVVLVLTSVRISRMNVISAIRVLPDSAKPDRSAPRRLAATALVAGVLVTAAGIAGPKAALALGPIVGLVGLGVLLRGRVSTETAITIASVPMLAWAGAIFPAITRNSTFNPLTLVALGLVLTAAGVMVVNAQQHRVADLLCRPLPVRLATTMRLGLAYPVAHRTRTLLTVAPFALVVFTLTYTEGFTHLVTSEFQRVTPRLGGNYEMFVKSSAAQPFGEDSISADPAVRRAVSTSTLIASVSRPADDTRRLWPLTAFDTDFVDVAPPPMVSRQKRFRSDAAAYRSVARDPDSVIVSTNFLFTRRQSFGRQAGKSRIVPPRPGDTFTIYDVASDRARDVTVAGVTYTDVVGAGMFYGRAGAQDLFGDRLKPTSSWVDVKSDPQGLKQRLERAGADSGVQATVVVDAATVAFSFVSDVVNLYRSDLGIGLVVGIAGIGVVLVRSVRERTRQIGALRALGFEGRQIGRSFLVEGAFVGIQGLSVGIGLGAMSVFTASRTSAVQNLFGYTPPPLWPPISIAVLGFVLLLAAMLASLGPARAASRIPPAVALRVD